jgi:tetratricopeptide (TPR) repeat protein
VRLHRAAIQGTTAALVAAAGFLYLAVAHWALAEPASLELVQANAALQAGEADKALALLGSLHPSDSHMAEAHNLECRVRLTLEQWDAAVNACQQAVRMDGQNSNYHVWLGRALGEKADRASFLTAFSLAKRVREEFEEAVKLNPRNAGALADLGRFYIDAPGVVGGGIDKATATAAQMEAVDAGGAHELRGLMAEKQKDYSTAEREFKLAIAAGGHTGSHWIALANFYRRRERWTEMEAAVHSGVTAAGRDKDDSLALFDGASVLSETHRQPEEAARILNEYLAVPQKTEEAPAFVALIELARLKAQLGDPAAANRDRTAALALANEYKPALELGTQKSQ